MYYPRDNNIEIVNIKQKAQDMDIFLSREKIMITKFKSKSLTSENSIVALILEHPLKNLLRIVSASQEYEKKSDLSPTHLVESLFPSERQFVSKSIRPCTLINTEQTTTSEEVQSQELCNKVSNEKETENVKKAIIEIKTESEKLNNSILSDQLDTIPELEELDSEILVAETNAQVEEICPNIKIHTLCQQAENMADNLNNDNQLSHPVSTLALIYNLPIFKNSNTEDQVDIPNHTPGDRKLNNEITPCYMWSTQKYNLELSENHTNYNNTNSI